MRFKKKLPAEFCPFCGEAVGYIGRVLDVLFGTRRHGCDFSNIDRAPPKPEVTT